MNNDMTERSVIMFNMATNKNMSISEAADMLKQCADFRTLSQKLNAFAKGRDIKKLLINGLSENHPDANNDTISRKVRNWLNDCQNTLHKQDAIELCFVLGLTLEESDAFVAMISDEALHWRNPDEIPYIFALSKGMSYTEAVELHNKISKEISAIDSISQDGFTDIVRTEIKKIGTQSELISYVINTKNQLGNFHNTAFEMFNSMMDVLENPYTELTDDDDYFPETEAYTVGKIVQAYMHREDIPEVDDKKKKNLYSALQRNILQNWPNETVLSRMKNRRCDITRKVLILLFLATYDSDSYIVMDEEKEDDYLYPEYGYEKSRDVIFKEFYFNMNAMLEGCGFKALDPRSPFDWIVIYCMCADDIYDVDGTFSEFLQAVFANEESGN